MPNLTLTLSQRRPFGRTLLRTAGGPDDGTMRNIIRALESVASGHNQGDLLALSVEDTNINSAPNDNCFPGQAVALLVGSSLSGSVGCTIDGTAVTTTASGGDAATMTALMTAIRANATVNRKVTAVNRIMRVTVGAGVAAGEKLVVCGAELVAVSGTPQRYGEFDRSSGVAATIATSLALAINRHPALSLRYRAVANSAVVNIGLTEERTPGPREYVGAEGAANITVNAKTPTQAAFGMVFAAQPGPLGNCCTAVASGTGMSLVTANAGKLGSGMGLPTSFAVVMP